MYDIIHPFGYGVNKIRKPWISLISVKIIVLHYLRDEWFLRNIKAHLQSTSFLNIEIV